MRKLPTLSSSYVDEFSSDREYFPPKKCGMALIFLVMGMVLFGVIMLYSTTSSSAGASMLIKQVMWIGLGIITVTLINIVGYRAIIPYAKYLLILSWGLLVAARFCREINGAYRWIPLPGGVGNIQPSELAKIAVVMFLAYYIPKNQRQMKFSLKALFYPLSLCAVTMGLVILGKDLGTTILIAAIIWLMLIVSGVRLRYLLPPVTLLPLLFVGLKFFDKMRWARVTSFLNPEVYQKTIGYQLWFSLLALGSGSWTGLGFTKSRMKAQYLPEAHTDFILAVVGEELGFICLAILIIAYTVFLVLSVFISIKAKDKEGMMLGFGASAMIALQAIINIGVVSGAFPTKGMPAPFISYGGSNIIVCLICAGFIVSIANSKDKEQKSNIGTKLR